jgi:hypothetical protein
MTDLAAAIKAINPDASVSIVGNDLDQITWLHGTSPIPDEAILAKRVELKSAYDAQAYARSRQAEYPPWEQQLDHIYHHGIASWKTNVVQPVKDKFPKPK